MNRWAILAGSSVILALLLCMPRTPRLVKGLAVGCTAFCGAFAVLAAVESRTENALSGRVFYAVASATAPRGCVGWVFSEQAVMTRSLRPIPTMLCRIRPTPRGRGAGWGW